MRTLQTILIAYIAVAISFFVLPFNVTDEGLDQGFTGGAISNKRIATASATSTYIYLEPETSSTTDNYVTSYDLEFSTADLEGFDMRLIAIASTSAEIDWTYYFSDDGIDWFPEDGTTDSSDVAMSHGATAYVHTWVPTAGSVQMHNTKYPTSPAEKLRARFTKVTFSTDVASSTLYAEIVR